MIEVKNSLKSEIGIFAKEFLKIPNDTEIQIVSHFDTDGISSATIMIKTLQKLDKKFSVKIIKSIEKDFIFSLCKDKPVVFLDIASSSIDYIKESGLENVFIIDHHQINSEDFSGIKIINSELYGNQELSSSCLTYLFCNHIFPNKNLAKLAVLGMIGDLLDNEIDEIKNDILNQGEIKVKKGLLLYPSTKPLNRVLEFSSNPYIPGVTGNVKGVLELLREIKINPLNGKYKSLIDLDKEEMKKLITAIILRNANIENKKLIGNIFLVKFFNKLEDVRELSAKINACSRLGRSDLALLFCMEVIGIKKQSESLSAKYKQLILSGLKVASQTQKIQGDGFTIINVKDKIRDTIIGTIASILSKSNLYDEGTTIITMAYSNDKIKISARNTGQSKRNLRETLSNIISQVGGEAGGHRMAAGALIPINKEQEFISELRKNLGFELIKI
jgi:RecJ-like exonuclease